MIRILPLACALALLAAGSARAHGGEDHAAPPPAAVPGGGEARVFEAQAPSYEGVLKFAAADAGEPLAMRLLLSDFATNAPVDGATVRMSVPDLKLDLEATPAGAGVYDMSGTPGRAGTYSSIVTVDGPAGADLLLFDAVTFGPAPGEAKAPSRRPWVIGGAVALVVAAALAVAWRAARGTKRSGAAALALLAAGLARAHGGEDHGEGAKSGGPSSIAVVAKEAQFAFGVRTIVATPVKLPGRRAWRGTVVARPNGKAEIIAPQAGRVVALDAALPQVGDAVRKGQPLLAIEGFMTPQEQVATRTDLAQAESRQVEAAQELGVAERQAARRRSVPELFSQRERDETDARLESARAADAAARRAVALLASASQGSRGSAARYVMTSPIDGVVSAGTATIGEAVESGHSFFTVLDTGAFWVRVDAPENDASLLDVGGEAPARVVVPGGAASPVEARFVSKGRTVDPATRTVPAFFETVGPPAGLLEGQLVEVRVDTGAEVTGFVVPASAIVNLSGRPVVFAHVQAEEFAPREVTLGLTSDDQVEVTSGIQDGDRVVVSGAFQIRSALLSGS